jgi:fluoroquinolone transport system permease protein
MNARKLISLSVFDCKNILRDKTLTAMVIMPFLIIAFLRLGTAPLLQAFPEVQPYLPVIFGYFCVLAAFFPGFIISFIMLDEKDENLLTVMRVMPVSPGLFLGYRLLFISVSGFLFSLLTIWLVPVFNPSLTVAISLAVLSALITPVTTLLVVTFARNKIEGITLLKGLNFALTLPLLAFVTDSAWANILGLLPVYWTYYAFQMADSPAHFTIIWLSGVAMHALYFQSVYRQFRKRVF